MTMNTCRIRLGSFWSRIQPLVSRSCHSCVSVTVAVHRSTRSSRRWTLNLLLVQHCVHRVITKGPATLVCDNVSYEFIRGATIDYTTELVRSSFEVRSDVLLIMLHPEQLCMAGMHACTGTSCMYM